MSLPKMILFDYGHTLIYEPCQDYLSGARCVMSHAVKNPHGVTAEMLHDICDKEYSELFSIMRPHNLETNGQMLDANIYTRLGLSFDIDARELEYEKWIATESLYPMEGIEALLTNLEELGIRTAVISNFSYSGDCLKRRINETLPSNRFEFILSSSESVYRKPSASIFETALGLAGLIPADCWFCGDDVVCDVEGASAVGMFPVWYKSPLKCAYKPEAAREPQCEHLRVSTWNELAVCLANIRGL